MKRNHRLPATVVLTTALALTAALAGAGTAAAATTAQYASGWSVNNNADWTPFPPSTNPLGAVDNLCTGGVNSSGGWAEFTFPGFGIPGGDTVTGIEVRVNYLSASGSNTVQLTDGGSLVGSTKSVAAVTGQSFCSNTAWTGTGGAGDLWGTSLTTADFNAGTVGFRLTQNANTVDLDAVELIVHHSGANTAPVASAGGPYAGNEGSPISLNGGSATDDGTIVLWEWDFQNDGTFDFSSPTSPNTSHTYPDNGSFTAVLRVTDDGGLTDTDNATVNVSNVAPTIALSGAASVDEGSPYSLTLGAITDPGTDTVTQWIVHWGDGSTDSYGSGGVKMHTYADGPTSPTIVVDLVDEDGTHLNAGSKSITVNNVPPDVDPPVVAPEPSDEGSAATATAAYSDPGTLDTHTCTVDYGEGDGPESGTASAGVCTGPSHTYGDNGSFTVTACVKDKDDAETCESSTHEVENVPPTVATPSFDPDPSDEGLTVDVSATFTDPGENDGPFTCTIDYGTGGGAESATVSGDTCTGSHAYGDNGTFTVEVCVKDKDDGEGCASAALVVNNLDPDVDLDTSTAVTFPSGELAFLGRRGVEQSHDADGEDPGSDDLTFDWDFGFLGSGVSNTYFNDGTGPDPFPSPGGTFPFLASDTASVTYTDGGIYTITVTVIDDDQGRASEELRKLVTGDGVCVYSQGFWRHQFAGRGRQHFDTLELQTFLDLVNFASGVFSEQTAASIPSEAQAVFSPGGSRLDRATAQALAAWLNWASGGVGWSESIDTDGDTVGDTPFSLLIAMVEAILLDPGATPAELELAKDLAEAVNLRDADNQDCGDFPRPLDGPLAITRQD